MPSTITDKEHRIRLLIQWFGIDYKALSDDKPRPKDSCFTFEQSNLIKKIGDDVMEVLGGELS